MRRFPRGLWLLAVVLPVVLVRPARSLAWPETETSDSLTSAYSDLYVPLVWRGVVRAGLRAVPGVTLTPTTAPTPTATPTITPTPTETPTPLPTPTRSPGGSITGRILANGEPIPIGMGVGMGPAIYLRHCTAGECTNVDRTAIEDDEGRYTFRDTEPLAPSEYYQVVWYNEHNPPVTSGMREWLGSYYGPRITDVPGGEVVAGGDFEVATIVLTEPTHGTGLGGLPWTFKWRGRQKETGTYRWGICDCCQLLEQRPGAWLTQSLGRSTEYELTFYPPGILIDYHYCWFVRLQTADGYGESYEIRMLWFFNPPYALSRLGLVDPADWGASPAPYPPGLRYWSVR